MQDAPRKTSREGVQARGRVRITGCECEGRGEMHENNLVCCEGGVDMAVTVRWPGRLRWRGQWVLLGVLGVPGG
jgi:hypothetical protein